MLQLQYQENGLSIGSLSLKRNMLLSRLSAQPSVISILSPLSNDRSAVEEFIRSVYADAYGAKISVHYPILMSIRNAEGEILAAAGFRPAVKEPLFLEQYLSRPVEEVLRTPRHEIVEIGNLASSGGGASLYLFAALAVYLNSKGYMQAVATSTYFLESRFRQMGLQPKRVAPADPNRLLSAEESWGSYYDTDPHVLSGSITRGYTRLEKMLGAKYHDARPHLFPRLHYRMDKTPHAH